ESAGDKGPASPASFLASRSTTTASSTLSNAAALIDAGSVLAQATSSPLVVSHFPASRIAASPANSTGAATLKPVRPSILHTRIATVLSPPNFTASGGTVNR